jgi:predicted TPR repeat methyltransferase
VAEPQFEIRLGEGADNQDEEWCEVTLDGERRRIRFHDYQEIYEIPGLYEQLFYDELECDSPRTLRELLEGCLRPHEVPEGELRAFDLGAGNGMMGEQLRDMGAEEVVGADLIAEAAVAAERDRPGVYDDYVGGDLTKLDDEVTDDLSARGFNCLTTVSALSFGDIPPTVFTQACDFIEPGGWVVFNIKEDFLGSGDDTGFSRLIRESVEDGALELETQRRYRHRLSVEGDPIHYVGFVARKRGDLPEIGA